MQRALTPLLTRRGARRLLSLDRDAVKGEAVVEAAHDAQLSGWTRLAG
jgi:hypothetical protein